MPDDKAETAVGYFEMVDRSESDSMSSGASQPCPPPLTQDEWFTFLDSSGEQDTLHVTPQSFLNWRKIMLATCFYIQVSQSK